MASLTFLAAIFFLFAAVVLFWLSRIIHTELVDDAILSLGLAMTALGLSQVITGGLVRSLPVLAPFLAVR